MLSIASGATSRANVPHVGRFRCGPLGTRRVERVTQAGETVPSKEVAVARLIWRWGGGGGPWGDLARYQRPFTGWEWELEVFFHQACRQGVGWPSYSVGSESWTPQGTS